MKADADIEIVTQAIADGATVPKYGLKVINYGNCMLCGKKLTDRLFFCKDCEERNRKREMNEDSNRTTRSRI